MDQTSTTDVDQGHVLELYDDEPWLVEIGRAMSVAISQGSAVVCIATDAHWRLLERHVVDCGIDIHAARAKGQIARLDAERTLSKISGDGSIDVVRFAEVVGAVIDGVSTRHLRVWIYGELVALMRAHGDQAGAIDLEKLWSSFTTVRPMFRSFTSCTPLAPVRDCGQNKARF